MVISILDYMKKTREERRNHLRLNTQCIEHGLRYSYHLTGLLAHIHETTYPQKGERPRAIVCHGCYNAKCSNPDHLYWGTHVDNHIDTVESGRYSTPWERTLLKYGADEAHRIISNNGATGGYALAGKPKSEEHRRRISEALLKE